ncbi:MULTISPECIES: heme biosynthesis protein HemY [unclassified Bartonella]|uniref:heme biosynthesis protein HemY n=1 Tax=unclassified Bartonella TaxID=2645622 RepID=UPI00099A5FDB|nr:MULTISPECIES: heme biosynthesis HemY N-terminal domain-containing protein [unclassified Bartonella]AQX28548.1 HemY protein [Bartonella sp. JB15]AQX29809.1 HemY protein [Bartonella sp. JB63]
MIRIFIYVFVVCVIGAIFSWCANNNSFLVITFLQMRFTVSLLTIISGLVILLVILVFLWKFFRIIFSLPRNLYSFFSRRYQKQSSKALTQGLLAAFAGDYIAAQKMEVRALRRLVKDYEPLIKLLRAQILSLQKNSMNAIALYEEMKRDEPTKLAGLYGLFREAMNMKAYDVAQHYAEEALTLSPTLVWAQQFVLDRLSAEGQWNKALDIFHRAQIALPRSEHCTAERKYIHALLLSGLALHLVETHLVEARKAILKAHKLMPDFVPITVVMADIFYKLKEIRKADKIIIKAWKENPHPDFGALYLRVEESAVGRLKRAKTLASYNKDIFESAFIVAKAALDAGELELAKEYAQKALTYHPRESVYLLLADIEEAQGNDRGSRQWLSLALRAERDPAWACDGSFFSSWSAVSPISGRLGRFEWKVPPRCSPITLEVDSMMLKKEDKKDNVDEKEAVKNKSFEEKPSIGRDFLLNSQLKKQNKKKGDQTNLNVENLESKEAKEGAFLPKEKFQLF